ncbi:S24 family peptidase [Variovorax ginsengisoli]|uniref:Peptidase S24/S26A/S26B/S26C domain-containing protein n=1 Tax=Variovorax ginsengisoli TaxID=363844 RepID=A0ABT9SGW4_9BURK|nr:S24 family peptidase [Variovorax ginsengisoli]MDP9902632.1 hypothetical protein [Variovorax ginsengisoli]
MQNFASFRRARLEQLADKLGGKATLGRKLGYKDGAFVGQMIRGERPITEKTLAAVHALPGFKGWFSGLGDNESQNSATSLDSDPIMADLVDSFGIRPTPVVRLRKIFVLKNATGGFIEEDFWLEDEDRLRESTGQFALIASSDPRAFLVEVGESTMSPRFNRGEYVLVEPGTLPELEDDVLVRFVNGDMALRRLASRRGGLRLARIEGGAVEEFPTYAVSWMYYVPHVVPRSRILDVAPK